MIRFTLLSEAATLFLLCVSSGYAADVILNEYNAVEDDKYLEDGASDAYWNQRLGNGDDWFELVVTADHVDMRGWEFVVVNCTLCDSPPDSVEESFSLTLSNDSVWSDLRRGTILTISEDLHSNVDQYHPEVGNWWLNIKADCANQYVSVACIDPPCPPEDANWKVSNNDWQLTIKNASGIGVFGPAGEGIRWTCDGGTNDGEACDPDTPDCPGGGDCQKVKVGSDEVFKLEENPSASVSPTSDYFDGQSSTFSQPNVWQGSSQTQDFASLRAVLPTFSQLTTVRINEINAHSGDILTDWIELYNTTDAPVDVGGWWLSDSFETVAYEIPAGTVVPPHDVIVFVDGEDGMNLGFKSQCGDEVILSATNGAGVLTGARDYMQFGPVENGVTYSRCPDGTGDVFRTTPTQGGQNAAPSIAPVVINEIMYHPIEPTPAPGSLDPEFIEIHNVSTNPVELFTDFGSDGVHAWEIAGGVAFTFPTSTVIEPGGFIIVVNFDPEGGASPLLDEFRSFYGMLGHEVIVGPYAGKLSNMSDEVRLRKPDTPETEGVNPCDDEGPMPFTPMVIVDEVTYYDFGDWPADADGTGASLERVDPYGDGRPPSNWMANAMGSATPGAPNSVSRSIPTLSGVGLAALLLGVVACAGMVFKRVRAIGLADVR